MTSCQPTEIDFRQFAEKWARLVAKTLWFTEQGSIMFGGISRWKPKQGLSRQEVNIVRGGWRHRSEGERLTSAEANARWTCT